MHVYIPAVPPTYPPTDRQTDRPIGRYADRQADLHTYSPTGTVRHTETCQTDKQTRPTYLPTYLPACLPACLPNLPNLPTPTYLPNISRYAVSVHYIPCRIRPCASSSSAHELASYAHCKRSTCVSQPLVPETSPVTAGV